MRRSSTSRSIGARSDFGAQPVEDERTPHADLDEEVSVNGGEVPDAEQYVDHYVESQVQRARDEGSFGVYEDEFETQA